MKLDIEIRDESHADQDNRKRFDAEEAIREAMRKNCIVAYYE